MGRLTDRHKDGKAYILPENGIGKVDYSVVRATIEKLAHYEDMEEQGRLIEQKHGTWESLDSYIYECDGMWECSECGEDFYFEFGTPLECRAYYCPNCGAKMELKELEGDKE